MAKFSEVTKLTKTKIEAAQHLVVDGKARHRLLWDTALKGFGCVIGKTARTYVVQRDVNGKAVRVKLGRHNPMTCEEARRKARKVLVKLGDGVNINQEKRVEKAKGATLREALDLMVETATTRGRSAVTIKGYRGLVEKYLAGWLDKPLAKITRQDIYTRHRQIAADIIAGKYAIYKKKGGFGKYKRDSVYWSGKHTANNTMRAFRAIYNRAMRQYETLPANPCVSIDWFPEKRRQAAIPSGELATWFEEVMQINNGIRRDFLLFVLLTGLRRTNASEIQWTHVDIQNKTLFIPKPKSGRPFTMPLSYQLVELLKRRRTENETFFPGSQWAFPAESANGHISEPKVDLSMKWTIHGLRNTYATVAESLDLSSYVLKALLNHALPRQDVTSGYLQMEVERLRGPQQAISDRLMALCRGGGGGDAINVVPFRGVAKSAQ